MLCIKPAHEGNGTGVARLATPTELSSLGVALRKRPLIIPGDIFSTAHAPIRMRPGAPPNAFVVEPFVATDGCALFMSFWAWRKLCRGDGHAVSQPPEPLWST